MHSTRSSEDIHRILVKHAEQERTCVLAVVLETDGSTPARIGAKTLLDAQGVIGGTIGGGQVEAEVQRRAAETIRIGRPIILDFSLDGNAVDSEVSICGGAMRVLMDPNVGQCRQAYASASAIRSRRQRGVLLTTARGRKQWNVTVQFLAESEISSRLEFPGAETVLAVLQREEPRLFALDATVDEQRLEVLIEPVIPDPVLLIVGGGHVGQAVAAQASQVGFDIVVIDDRPEFTRLELFPDSATMCCGGIGEQVAGFPFGRDTFIVIVTRGHQHDADALAACIHEPVAYIGMIGSRRKVAMMQRKFVESGRCTSAEFDRVCAPIGLDIGAVTVPEIATSIVSQLIAARRKGDDLTK